MDLEKLKEEQIRLGRKLVLVDDFSAPSTIAGCQVFYTPTEQIAVAVLLDLHTYALLDKKYVVSKPKIPYVPSFQSYREIPPVIEAISLLSQRPDLIVYQGEGVLHPRKMGSASHLGLALDIPTIGVSKKLCYGEARQDGIYVNNEKRGAIVKTRDHAKPLHVSPGHRISLETSQKLVVSLTREGSKLPEPLRVAHNYGLFLKKNLHNEADQQWKPDASSLVSSA